VPAVQASLKELWARREQLVQALEAEQKRLQVATHPLVRASLKRTIAVVQEEVAQIEPAIAALVASDEALAQKAALSTALRRWRQPTVARCSHTPSLWYSPIGIGSNSRPTAASCAATAPLTAQRKM